MTDGPKNKADFRSLAQSRRQAQGEKDAVSRQIMTRVAQLAEFQSAVTVMSYIDVRDEVRTRETLSAWLDERPGERPDEWRDGGRRIAIPFCVRDRLKLFHLEAMDELERGAFGILEPREGLRALLEKRVDPREVDLVLVPGVAFDRRGARCGHGWGFFDKLLPLVRDDACLIGLAFDCQVFDEIAIDPHDVLMDKIVTQSTVYTGSGRRC